MAQQPLRPLEEEFEPLEDVFEPDASDEEAMEDTASNVSPDTAAGGLYGFLRQPASVTAEQVANLIDQPDDTGEFGWPEYGKAFLAGTIKSMIPESHGQAALQFMLPPVLKPAGRLISKFAPALGKLASTEIPFLTRGKAVPSSGLNPEIPLGAVDDLPLQDPNLLSGKTPTGVAAEKADLQANMNELLEAGRQESIASGAIRKPKYRLNPDGTYTVLEGVGPIGQGRTFSPNAVSTVKSSAAAQNIRPTRAQGDAAADELARRTGLGGGGAKPPIPPKPMPSHGPAGPVPDPMTTGERVAEVMNIPRAMTTIGDLSAPFRQGLGLIHKKAWWTSWDDMLKGGWSQNAYDDIMSDILKHENFIPRPQIDKNGKIMYDAITKLPKMGDSFAKDAGLALTDLKGFTKIEEQLGSRLLGKLPGYGNVMRGSNRAYVAFLNKLRADTFNSLVSNAEKAGLNPRENMVLARELAAFVNNASGRGNLAGLEKHAGLLTSMFFSPRLIASRLQMMNPRNYLSSNVPKTVRQEYWKSLFAIAGFGNTLLALGKLGGADVSMNPTSADFGKVRIGNTRLDPWGGFQQYVVLATRLMRNEFTSSVSGNEYELGSNPTIPTRANIGIEFIKNKTQPLIAAAYDWANARPNRPFNVPERAMQLIAPMVAMDIYEMSQQNPELIPWLAPLAATGMGTQSYDGRK